jgi:hypothetical protein
MANDNDAEVRVGSAPVDEPVNEERALAFELWQRSFEMDEYSDDGQVLKWMNDPPTSQQVEEWTGQGLEYYFVVFPDRDGRFHANVPVYACKQLSYDFYKKLTKKQLDQLQSMEHVLAECVLAPKLSLSDLVQGKLPSGIVYTLYRRIQDASGWNESTLISKN